MENKELLINILTLTQALKDKDQTAIDTSIANLNALDLNSDNEGYVKDFIKNSAETKETLLYMVEHLDLIQDKAFFNSYVELKTAIKLPKDTLVDYLNTDLVFTDDYDKYLYFSVLTKRIVDLGDSVLIKAAIDKIQSI